MRSLQRIAALRARMAAEQAPAFAAIQPINVAYLTGFERVFDEERAHVALVTEDALVLFTDSRYSEAAKRAAEGTDWEVRQVAVDIKAALDEALKQSGLSDVAVEDSIPHSLLLSLETSLSGGVRATHGWVESLRLVKEPDEVKRIADAQELTDRAFEHILGLITVGMSERDIALEIEFFMRKAGSEGVAFAPIVASGPNSALPHAKATDRGVSRGDFLKMDFGARVGGYCADMTRTIVVGNASQWQLDVYQTVLAANLAGIEAVSAGVPGRDIDAAARKVIEDAGYGPLFAHGLGHGVGMEVHEAPGAGPRSDDEVPDMSVITIEPGIYEPGRGGVRIEDLVVVREDGAHVLTRSPKDLIEL